ncbi:MAG TPA: hypothetical protein VMS96_12650 [Terriglobales bacterium]|nr:hypothetical protein [Terriglobales bacterium]
MAEFAGRRVIREYLQTNDAAPEKLFPLLCPVREAEWVPGWEYRLIFSRSGIAELGCVFSTPNEDGSETTWITIEYEPPRGVGFVWVWPGMVTARLRFDLEAADGKTRLRARYEYTGLSEKGNAEVERYSEKWFAEKMKKFEAALNHYLATGRMIAAGAWE